MLDRVKPAATADDAARLAALHSYSILDTPEDQGFDDIVLLAAQICAAPVALVSLVANDRQWFKARHGFDGCETPLTQSICAHTLLQPGLMIIPDLTQDPRTRDNALVTGAPAIRFYAGARLETPEGTPLGALCVIDTVPRPHGLTPPQSTALEALGRQVMALMELHRANHTLEARVHEAVRVRSRTWDVTPDLLGVLNAQGIFESSNPAWQKLLGWPVEHIARTSFFEFLHPDDVPKNQAAWREALAGQPVLNFENRYRHVDGSYRWLSWVAVPEDNKVYCSARDITTEKAQAAALGESTQALMTERQTAELREQFIAVLGHDLRNPLASIDACARLLGKEVLSERAVTMVRHLHQAVVRMTGLIDNVLDFARGRLGGGLTLSRDGGDVRATIEQVVREVRTTWPDQALDQHIAIAAKVRCDTVRIGQLLSNLLTNAVRHSAPGQAIQVRAVTESDRFEISVVNHGPPIDEASLGQLFQPFFRGAVRADQQGLGLGLYIASEIARAHGGRIDVLSSEGETRFTFGMALDGVRKDGVLSLF